MSTNRSLETCFAFVKTICISYNWVHILPRFLVFEIVFMELKWQNLHSFLKFAAILNFLLSTELPRQVNSYFGSYFFCFTCRILFAFRKKLIWNSSWCRISKITKIKPVELSLCLSDKRITWKWENIFA